MTDKVTPISAAQTDGGEIPAVSCARCCYAVARPVMDQSGAQIIGEVALQCQRYPPQIVLALAQTPQGTVPIFPPGVTFPPVTPEIWCHEWEPGEPHTGDTPPLLDND